MSGNRAWPNPVGVDPKYDRCVYAIGQYWWARKHPTCNHYVRVVPANHNRLSPERSLWTAHVEDTRYFPVRGMPMMHTTPELALYSAISLNPTGMGWVKNPTGPVVTMRAPYDEMLTRAKQLAEMYPDSTYTVVKVCAEVRTPPKPTLEVKEY